MAEEPKQMPPTCLKLFKDSTNLHVRGIQAYGQRIMKERVRQFAGTRKGSLAWNAERERDIRQDEVVGGMLMVYHGMKGLE